MIRALGLSALAAFALAACNPPAPRQDVDISVADTSVSPPPGVVVAPSAEPAYVGAWAANASSCPLEQDDLDAPTLFTANGYDQFEAHCDFETITPAGANEWDVKGRCMTAINQEGAFKIKVEGDRLTLSSDHGSVSLVRCPSTE